MSTTSVGTVGPRSKERRAWRAFTALAVAIGAPLSLALPKADASVVVGTTPTFPAQVNVGDTNVPASVTLVNSSTAPHHTGPMMVTQVMLLPSCGNRNLNCEGGADPGVFELSPSGQGGAGTNCAGRTFAVRVIDQSSGRANFLPVDNRPLVLGAPDATTELDTCRIDFSFSVRKAPTIDSAAQTEGMQTNQVAWMVTQHGDGSLGFDQGDDVTTVSPNVVCNVLAMLGLC
jgi:hypothetical protein